MRPLLLHFLERHCVAERDTGVPGQQLQQLQLEMPDLPLVVQRVERAVRPPPTCDRPSAIVCKPGSADQTRSSNPPALSVVIITVLPDRISSPTKLSA